MNFLGNFLSPINPECMENVRFDKLLCEVHEMQLCDAKMRLEQFNALQEALINELYEGETKHLLIKKRQKRIQDLRDARKRLQGIA